MCRTAPPAAPAPRLHGSAARDGRDALEAAPGGLRGEDMEGSTADRSATAPSAIAIPRLGGCCKHMRACRTTAPRRCMLQHLASITQLQPPPPHPAAQPTSSSSGLLLLVLPLPLLHALGPVPADPVRLLALLRARRQRQVISSWSARLHAQDLAAQARPLTAARSPSRSRDPPCCSSARPCSARSACTWARRRRRRTCTPWRAPPAPPPVRPPRPRRPAPRPPHPPAAPPRPGWRPRPADHRRPTPLRQQLQRLPPSWRLPQRDQRPQPLPAQQHRWPSAGPHPSPHPLCAVQPAVPALGCRRCR
jgi:hypothetical protein